MTNKTPEWTKIGERGDEEHWSHSKTHGYIEIPKGVLTSHTTSLLATLTEQIEAKKLQKKSQIKLYKGWLDKMEEAIAKRDSSTIVWLWQNTLTDIHNRALNAALTIITDTFKSSNPKEV